MTEIFLIYNPSCPKCRALVALVRALDIWRRVTLVSFWSERAEEILHGYYDEIPYNYHLVDVGEEECYTGKPAIPHLMTFLLRSLVRLERD